MTRQQRATFNLDLVEAGHAAPFVIYPSVPGELDLPLLLEAASAAVADRVASGRIPRRCWPMSTALWRSYFKWPARSSTTGRSDRGEVRSWRERYCVDVRTRSLHGPEDYFGIAPEYRLWIWPRDLNEAIGRLNLVPSPRFVGAS
jgi:hypothetical protein